MTFQLNRLEQAFGLEFLDGIVEWVEENVPPQNLYSKYKLKQWAEYNGYVAESNIAKWAATWAKNNGYVPGEQDDIVVNLETNKVDGDVNIEMNADIVTGTIIGAVFGEL